MCVDFTKCLSEETEYQQASYRDCLVLILHLAPQRLSRDWLYSQHFLLLDTSQSWLITSPFGRQQTRISTLILTLILSRSLSLYGSSPGGQAGRHIPTCRTSLRTILKTKWRLLSRWKQDAGGKAREKRMASSEWSLSLSLRSSRLYTRTSYCLGRRTLKQVIQLSKTSLGPKKLSVESNGGGP